MSLSGSRVANTLFVGFGIQLDCSCEEDQLFNLQIITTHQFEQYPEFKAPLLHTTCIS
jgi:hypothetical protein